MISHVVLLLLQFDGMVRSTSQATGEDDAEPWKTYDEMNYSSGRLVDPEDCDTDGDLNHSQKRIIKELLGEWLVIGLLYLRCCYLHSLTRTFKQLSFVDKNASSQGRARELDVNRR